MYESRKNMGNVCKDVSSSIEKRKDVLSEEHDHNRDSEQRQDEVKLHLSDTAELGIEDYVVHDLGKVFSQENVIIECEKFVSSDIVVRMKLENKVMSVMFTKQELQLVKNIYGYIVAVCIQKFEEALKGVTK